MFDPEQSHTICTGCRRPGRSLGDGDIHLHERSSYDGGSGYCGRYCLGLFCRNFNYPFVDISFLTINRNKLPVGQHTGRSLCSDYCRCSQFTAHDRGMAGQASLIGNNGCNLPHRWYHVGIRHLRDKNIPCFYLACILCIPDYYHIARSNARSRTLPLDEYPCAITLSRTALCLFPVPDSGNRAGLEDINGTFHDAPFHILGNSIVILGDFSIHTELANLFISEYPGILPEAGNVQKLGSVVPVSNDLDFLIRDKRVDNLFGPLVEDIFVRGYRAGNNRFTQSPGTFDYC